MKAVYPIKKKKKPEYPNNTLISFQLPSLFRQKFKKNPCKPNEALRMICASDNWNVNVFHFTFPSSLYLKIMDEIRFG